MKQGEIYLLQWDPSVGHEFRKSRPGVVISSEKNLKKSNLVTFLPLTKTTTSPIREDIFIQKDAENRLMTNSLIKVHHISSFDKTRIIRHIGEVSGPILNKTKQYLKGHFDL